LGRICVLLPHLPTLPDSHLVELIRMTGLEEGRLADLVAVQDCTHVTRCHRTARFNEFIAQNLPSDEHVGVYRIDDQMADETGLILPGFLRDGEPDIHARSDATVPLWWELLKDEMPDYRMTGELYRHARGEPPAISQDLDE
jgi:hypothetical protein